MKYGIVYIFSDREDCQSRNLQPIKSSAARCASQLLIKRYRVFCHLLLQGYLTLQPHVEMPTKANFNTT